MTRKAIFFMAMCGACPRVAAEQQVECVVKGRKIMQHGKEIGGYNGEHIVRLPDMRGVGKRDGNYIIRLSDRQEVCRQDGDQVVRTDTGEKLGQGDAAALCLCAGLLR